MQFAKEGCDTDFQYLSDLSLNLPTPLMIGNINVSD